MWKIFKATILNGIWEAPVAGIINDSRKPSGKPYGTNRIHNFDLQLDFDDPHQLF